MSFSSEDYRGAVLASSTGKVLEPIEPEIQGLHRAHDCPAKQAKYTFQVGSAQLSIVCGRLFTFFSSSVSVFVRSGGTKVEEEKKKKQIVERIRR